MQWDDVTSLMNGYRECVRHLWNTYFWKDADPHDDWDLRDNFNDIAVELFRALVLRKLDRDEAELLPDQVAPRQPLGFLRVEAPSGSTIHINRSAEMTSG